jgi:hypothetical protein
MVHWYWANAAWLTEISGVVWRCPGKVSTFAGFVQILGKLSMLSGGENNIGFEAYNFFGYSLDKLKIELHG